MRSWMAAAVVAFFLVFSGAPQRAFADTGGAQDCSSGCYIITCDDDGLCTLWYCSGTTGCILKSTFRQQEKALDTRNLPLSDIPPTGQRALFAKGPVHIKMCPVGKACQVVEFNGGKKTDLGAFDNIDSLVNERRGQIEAAGER